MKNKHVGFIVLGAAILVFLIVLSFNNALESIVNETCDHGIACPMQTTLTNQKAISYSLMGVFFISGLYLILFGKDDAREAKAKVNIKNLNLDADEKKIVDSVTSKEGSIYQSDLIKETGFSKVKTSRVLDKLEGKGAIERKRRGMTNIIILK